MSRTWVLLKAQILDFFPINELREANNKKRNMAVIVGLGITTLVLFLCGYNILTVKALVQAGEQELIPAYMVSVSSFSILFLTMFYSNGILFGCKDIENLTALPVKSSEIISSKFSFMYLLNLLLAVIFMIPGGTVWIISADTDVLRSVLFMLSTFFVPIIPMCIASVIGVLIAFVSSRFKNRSIFAVLLSFIALGLVAYFASFSMYSGNQDISNIGAMLAGQITGLYPLSKFFLQDTDTLGIFGTILFLMLSLAVLFLFIKMVALKYSYFNTLASWTSKYKKHTVSFKEHSPFIALYQKEFGRFFSSYMAVLNTGFGTVLLCVFGILLLIVSPEKLGEYTGVPNMNVLLVEYAPLVVVSMLCLGSPSASSISLEGKNIWILQSTPISMKTILNSKIAVTLTLHFFGYLLSVFAMLTRLQMNIGQAVSLIIIPICYSLFIAVMGISLNKKYPSFDWSSEVMVVKQSIPVMVSLIVGMVFAFSPILLNMLLQFPILPMLWTIAGMLLIVTVILYRKACVSNYI